MITKVTITAATPTNQILDIYSGPKGILVYDAVGPIIRTIIADTLATPASLAAGLATIE